MGKLLKPLVILFLLLSIAALVMASMLYSQREILKGRIHKLERSAERVANNLRMENFKVARLKNFEQMQFALTELEVKADNQYEELQATIKDLAETRELLAQTQAELETTKEQLRQAKAEIERLEGELADLQAELAEANNQIDILKQEKSALEVQVEELNSKIVQIEDEKRDIEDRYTVLSREYEKLVLKYEGPVGKPVPTGLHGRVLLVNPKWNFVILNTGADAGLRPMADMLIHRDDKLIGKVRISDVRDDMAVAEILTDWEQAPIQVGDDAFH